MKNKIAILFTIAALMTACGTTKQAAQPDTTSQSATTTTSTVNPAETIIATLGGWQTMQTGGNIKLNAGSSFSSSIQVRMVRDEAIFISLRPVLGIEVGKLIITADSLYAVDKVHKRYLAEKVSILTSGIPVTVSDVQDIFLGRPFILGNGTLNEGNKNAVTAEKQGNGIVLTAEKQYKGYGYAFAFDKNNRITSLNIVPAGSTAPAYQVKYSGVRSTTAGNIAHDIDVDATVDKKKVAFSLEFKNIDWNGKVKIDKNIPSGYKRMNARDLFSMFSN